MAGILHLGARAGAGEGAAAVLPLLAESESRFRRFRSVFRSAMLWYRRSRSFSRAVLTMRSSSAGSSGLSLIGDTGALFRIASKMTADVLPANGCLPVAIS
jgi:hypothetical protein